MRVGGVGGGYFADIPSSLRGGGDLERAGGLFSPSSVHGQRSSLLESLGAVPAGPAPLAALLAALLSCALRPLFAFRRRCGKIDRLHIKSSAEHGQPTKVPQHVLKERFAFATCRPVNYNRTWRCRHQWLHCPENLGGGLGRSTGWGSPFP